MIILCDDGSLKIYVADKEKTEYWLQPHLQSTNAISQLKSSQMWSSTSLYQLSPLSIFHAFNKPEPSPVESKSSPSATDAPKEGDAEESKAAEKSAHQVAKPKPVKRTNAMKKKAPKQSQQQLQQQQASRSLVFPIDYFEKCTQLNDVEYGGNDLLEVYNQQQLKSRLSMGGKS